MQASLSSVRAPAFTAKARMPTRTAVAVVRCQATEGRSEQIKAGSMAMAAALVLLSTPAADAKLPSAYENSKSKAYEEQLLAAIASRGGAALPDLTASPKGEAATKAAAAPALKFDGVEQVKAEAPAAVPTPEPAKPAAPVVAAPRAAATSSSASASSSTDAAAPADNKGLLAIGGIVVLGAAAAAASNGNNGEGAMAAAGGAPAAAATASTGASDVLPNVAEARAWISAWKKRSGKA